ncbi:MAG: hemerythrin domain-containing protein [Rhizobacter sp.]
MPTASSQSASRTQRTKELDAIELLENDHKEVKSLFRKFNKLAEAGADAKEREALALQICSMLTVHAQIEEEILYPEARDVVPDEGLVKEAIVEHASAKDLIAQIESMDPKDEMYDAKVKVLGEYIDHHVKEEEEELFPKIRRRMDIRDAGMRLKARKDELTAGAASH